MIRSSSQRSLLGSVTAINVLGNMLGVGLTFIYFGVLMPRLLHGSPIGNIGSALIKSTDGTFGQTLPGRHYQ